jgi:hypothetical protein
MESKLVPIDKEDLAELNAITNVLHFLIHKEISPDSMIRIKEYIDRQSEIISRLLCWD